MRSGLVVRRSTLPIGKAVRRRAIVGVVEFRACDLPAGLQSEKQRAGDCDGRYETKSNKNLAGEPHDRRPIRPKAHFQPLRVSRKSLRRVTRDIGHECGLPSVRTIRTFFWYSPPSRSSAAANSRSTIM